MRRLNSNSDNKKTTNKDNSAKRTIYVYPGKTIIAKVLNEPVKSKYSYGVEIQPLDGNYYDSKNKKWYNARQLAKYRVILNLKKAEGIRKGDILVKGIDEDQFVILGDENNEKAQ